MAQHLSKALSELITMRGLAGNRGDDRLTNAWEEVAGTQIAERTKVLGIRRGVLQIGVATAPLLSELVSFRKTEFLDALQTNQADLAIRDLKFRLQSSAGR